MELIERRIEKVINPHSLVFLIQRDCRQETDFSIDILLFLLRYSFLLTDKTQDHYFFKRDYSNHGDISTQNPNGARYLDPKYSRWLSTDPAFGEYVPSAGKSNEADKLPGMGGIFNSVNLSLYHYAGNNPIKYVDPDGREDEIGSKTETWYAKEFLVVTGIDVRAGTKGSTTMNGKAVVSFSNDDNEIFIKVYDVLIEHSYGFYCSGGATGSFTEYSRTFKEGVSKEDVIKSFEGIFGSKNEGLGTVSVGVTFSISTDTYDIDQDGWVGFSRGFSASIGSPVNFGIQFSVYRDPSKPNNEFSDHPEWFPWKFPKRLKC